MIDPLLLFPASHNVVASLTLASSMSIGSKRSCVDEARPVPSRILAGGLCREVCFTEDRLAVVSAILRILLRCSLEGLPKLTRH